MAGITLTIPIPGRYRFPRARARNGRQAMSAYSAESAQRYSGLRAYVRPSAQRWVLPSNALRRAAGMGQVPSPFSEPVPLSDLPGLGTPLSVFPFGIPSGGVSTAIGDVSPAGDVTAQDATGNTVSLGTIDSSGSLQQTPAQSAAADGVAAAQGQNFSENLMAATAPATPATLPLNVTGPTLAQVGQSAPIVSTPTTSWLNGTTTIGGTAIKNSTLAIGGIAGIAALALLSRKKRR